MIDTKKKTLIIFLIALFIIISIYLTPKVIWLSQDNNKQIFINKINSLGILGYLILVSINAIQVIVAFLPGELFEIISGLMYGPWLGFLCVELGIALGSVIIISLMKSFKLNNKKNESKLKSKKIYQILRDSNRLEVILFFITLMPCVPKDLIVYIIPFTELRTVRFLTVNAIARIPSIISSTYFGASLITGNYITAIIVYILQLLIGVIGLIYNKRITKIIYKMNNESKNDK